MNAVQDLRDFLPFLFQFGLPTSMEDEAKAEVVDAFPNPFVDEMRVQMDHPFTYRLFSMDGQEKESGSKKHIPRVTHDSSLVRIVW